jgi:hypothetical protein
VTERLPPEFAEQIVDMLTSLFSVHSIGIARTYDLPEIAEATWHGACLATAELARRDLIGHGKMSDFVDWMTKVCCLHHCSGEYLRFKRPSTLISEKALIPSVQVFETLLHMPSGRQRGLSILKVSSLTH